METFFFFFFFLSPFDPSLITCFSAVKPQGLFPSRKSARKSFFWNHSSDETIYAIELNLVSFFFFLSD